MPRKICVLGAGAWGLTLADYLARRGERVTVWDRKPEAIDELKAGRTRNRPKGLVVHEFIEFKAELGAAAEGKQFIVCAVPSHAVAGICAVLKPLDWPGSGCIFVSCSKGIEQKTLRLPSQIFMEVMGERADIRFAALAGPSHAEEVCRNIPTAVVCCAAEPADADAVQGLFAGKFFRVYTQNDCAGVELGGALKNVIAIAAGACDGMGFGDNTKAALVTRGVAEIARAAVAMGAEPGTVAGLSGLGDLIVTAMSQHSRNRLFGELLAQGLAPVAALEKVGAAVEGYRTAESAHELAGRLGVEMPIVSAVYRVLYEGVPLEESIAGLLARDVGAEGL